MNNAENHISLSELHESTEFKSLTSNQQNWFDRYAATGNPRQATTDVYPKAKKLGQSYTSQLTQKLLSAPRVRAVLALYWQWDDRQVYLDDLEHSIRKAKGGERAQLLALKAKVLGLVPEDVSLPGTTEGESGQHTFAVGSVVEQSGHRFKIVAEEIA